MSPPVPFGSSTDHRPPVGSPLVPVGGVTIGACVFILNHHQISWHLLELVDQPLPLHFSEYASLIVVSKGESRYGAV